MLNWGQVDHFVAWENRNPFSILLHRNDLWVFGREPRIVSYVCNIDALHDVWIGDIQAPGLVEADSTYWIVNGNDPPQRYSKSRGDLSECYYNSDDNNGGSFNETIERIVPPGGPWWVLLQCTGTNPADTVQALINGEVVKTRDDPRGVMYCSYPPPNCNIDGEMTYPAGTRLGIRVSVGNLNLGSQIVVWNSSTLEVVVLYDVTLE
jgi:hypothetical protein